MSNFYPKRISNPDEKRYSLEPKIPIP